jgi:hypothetical protein
VYDKNYVHVFPEVDSFLAGKAQSQFRNLSVQVLRSSHLSSLFPLPLTPFVALFTALSRRAATSTDAGRTR